MLDECFDNHIVVILRFYVTLLTLLPPTLECQNILGGQKGQKGHFFPDIPYYRAR